MKSLLWADLSPKWQLRAYPQSVLIKKGCAFIRSEAPATAPRIFQVIFHVLTQHLQPRAKPSVGRAKPHPHHVFRHREAAD